MTESLGDAMRRAMKYAPAPKCPLCGEAVLFTGFAGVECVGNACANRSPDLQPDPVLEREDYPEWPMGGFP